MKKLVYTLAAIGLAAGAAQAQSDTEAAPESEAVPADAPAAAVSASYTDAQIESFAKAAVKVREITADASLDATQKQVEATAAVTAAGLEPAEYNEIAEAVSNDPALLARVQDALGRHADPAG